MRHLGRLFVPLAFHPDLAVGEMLFLPDWNQALQPVDAFQRGGERRFPMRRGDNDGDAGFTDFQPTQAMDHRDAADFERAGDLAADLSHHFDGHPLIAFVFQEPGWTALGIIPHNSLKHDDRAVFATQEPFGNFARIDWLPRERVEVSLRAANLVRVPAGTTAHWRQK